MDLGTTAFPIFFIFLGLKLSGAVNWGWGWVTAPLWIDAALSVIVIGVMFVFGISFFTLSKKLLGTFRDAKKSGWT